MKKLKFYYLLFIGLFFFTLFTMMFNNLSFIILSIFFILVIVEKFLRTDIRFKKLSELKQSVNKYFRYIIMYPWLFFLLIGSYNENERILEPTKIVQEQDNKSIEEQLNSIETLAPKHIESNKKPVPKDIKLTKELVKNNKYIKAKVLSNHDGDTLTVSINGSMPKSPPKITTFFCNTCY